MFLPLPVASDTNECLAFYAFHLPFRDPVKRAAANGDRRRLTSITMTIRLASETPISLSLIGIPCRLDRRGITVERSTAIKVQRNLDYCYYYYINGAHSRLCVRKNKFARGNKFLTEPTYQCTCSYSVDEKEKKKSEERQQNTIY